MARAYKTVNELVPELEQMINGLKSEGVKVLPSERNLAQQTGSSVMTLRKALLILEKRGLFIKNKRVRMIGEILETNNVPLNISVAFIARGQEYPSNTEWLRLNHNLGEKLRKAGAEFQTICLSADDTRETIALRLGDDVKVIVFADSPDPKIWCEVMSLRDQILIIGVDENYVGKCDCVVALNNYKAGYLAAQKLIKAGCKRPAVNYSDRGNMPFFHRRDGFIDALIDAGLPYENCAYATRAPGELAPGEILFPDALETICKNGHDGFFLFTDGQSQQVREFIQKKHKIPEEFKLITLDSCGECRRPESVISSISHATEETASKLVEVISKLSRGEQFASINLVESVYTGGETICKTETNYKI